MEEALENGKESSHSAHANGIEYSEASNIHQFHLHPHFPKPFFSEPTPIKSLCSTHPAWTPATTPLTPQALHFLPRSVNTLQSVSNYCSPQNMYLSPTHSGSVFSQWPVYYLHFPLPHLTMILSHATSFTKLFIAVTNIFIF
jgi:hypothetical protein